MRESLLAMAQFTAKVGTREEAAKAYERTLEKTVGAGQKIDIVLTLVRIGLAANDFPYARKNISRAKDLMEKGGDWERRNRLRVCAC